MAELREKLLNLDITDDIFKDVKYFITGEVHEQTISLLKSGGAEHQNYFSDYVTHLIVGDNPEENDLADANDVYEIPAVTPRWILMCASLKRRLDPNPYFYITEAKIFSGQIFCFSKLNEDRNHLWGLVTYNGGMVHLKLTGRCSFLVTGITEGPKYDKAYSLGPDNIKIVTPDWILEALKIKGFPDPALFHPKLINWPRPVKPPEPTTAITGFEPDTSENAVKVEDKTLPDSTQALLEKLKQRMPWNQPPNSTIAPVSTSIITSSSDPVAPPNVVAPSFLNRRQQQQQSFKPPVSPIQTSQPAPVSGFAPAEPQSPIHVPRSIVHHTPNNQPPIQHNININRLMQPQANRPPTSLQQLRGQLNTSQIHQQLLQQRMHQQQTQQNIIQRTSTGSIIMNQQLLHQHLSQGQHQVLQNQLRNQQNLMNQQQNLINQNQNMNQNHQGPSPMPMQVDSQDGLLGQQSQSNSIPFRQPSPITSQANQQNEINHQRSQIERSPSHIQIPSSPQHNQGQLLSPQHQLLNQQQNQQPSVNQLHQHQQTSQLMNQQQVPNQPQVHQQTTQLLNQQQVPNQPQVHQQTSQLLNQPQVPNQSQVQNQLNVQQDRNQLLNQQQDRNQLLNQQQDRNQLLNQQQLIQQQQNQNNQQLLSQQQQIQNELQLLGQQSPQNPQIMQQNQQIIQQNQNQMMQNQQNQQMIQQNQQIVQQNQQMVQQQNHPNQQNQQSQQLSQQNQGPLIRQTQIISQQLINTTNQHQHNNQQTLLGLPPNHHLSQLNPQQLQQLQQLKREQQQLLNQSQNQLTGMNQQTISLNQQNIGLNQQNIVSQSPNQQIVNQNPQIVSQSQQIPMSQQQLIQNRVIQQQNQQNFNQPGLNQHILNQKQQMFGQQQINTSQHSQQLIQNHQNLTSQPQFVNQNQFEAIQQQKQQNQLNQMNVQSLNQQLQQQNLGQQLNQQLMQQNQQQQPNLGLEQNLGLINQQQQPPQQQQQQQQGLNPQQALNQQINPVMTQQVIRAQFPQQVLVNQGPQAGPQRAQLGPQIWPPPQQQQVAGQIQGQQIIRHPVNVSVQQSSTPGAVPRIQWPPGQQPQRQLIQLDAHTHNQLQKMAPDQQALFVAKLQQKQRQLQLAKQAQQRASGHILIRGNVPQGLTPQQQVQWLQQQAKQQGIVLPPNIQQNLTPGTAAAQQPQTSAAVQPQHAPGLSPINQPSAPAQGQPFVVEQSTQQQLQLKQYRLQQLQREQAHKNALAQQGGIPPQAVIRPPQAQTPAADPPANPQVQVNPKTKTALANMLSIKLQSGGTIGASVRPEGIPEPSAAGTLRMMTAQHNAAINSKPQEIIALHQRRTISGPNGEIIKTPGVPALPVAAQADPPKLQFNQKSPVPVQHRVGPFYGHNPNLKLPPDLFLLGCIFVVVEVEEYLDEKLPGWQQKIEKYGGEVEKQYCSKVTHVLCETQRHGVVMQALRDLKRCVTIRWLSDVIIRKQVLPPWTALHLPQIYLDLSPASKQLISISGFEGNLRKIVKQMIISMGAKCTNYFSKHNTLLICSKAEGKKFDHAKKWGTPVVNVQWLTDIILGNFTAMTQMENQAYQTYCIPPNFSFDPKLVPNMMHAWKAPINISQESYERVKRSASPVSLPKAKKMKIEHIDENENITDEAFNPDYKILFSQFEPDRLKQLERVVRELGGIVASDHREFTHLVVPKLSRSHKLLFAIVKAHPILPEKWLEDSLAAKNFLPESDFGLPTEEFNQAYGTSYEQALQSCNRQKLLDGKTFYVTPSVFPNKRIVCELIELSGGKLERIRRSRAQIEATNATSPLSYFILTAREDLHLVADLLKNKKDRQKVVCNVELVLSAVMKQEFDVEPYAVSVV